MRRRPPRPLGGQHQCGGHRVLISDGVPPRMSFLQKKLYLAKRPVFTPPTLERGAARAVRMELSAAECAAVMADSSLLFRHSAPALETDEKGRRQPKQTTPGEATATDAAGGSTPLLSEPPARRSKRPVGEQMAGPSRDESSPEQSPKKQKVELTAREQAQLRILASVPGLQPTRDARGRRKAVSVDLSAHLSALVSGDLAGAAHDTHLSSPARDAAQSEARAEGTADSEPEPDHPMAETGSR